MVPHFGAGLARIGRVVLVLLVAVMAATWSGAGADREATPPSSRQHIVQIRGFAFEPAELRTQPGDTVVWINRDVVPHTATAHDRRWDTGDIAAGGSALRVLGNNEAADYFCLYHPGMKGRLTVRRASGSR